jgi:predicted 3-demethylubiquinone-9 3-methyltransferase (glyoxalase superfamily)
MPTISPFLWFEGNMQEAVRFYASVFKNARIESLTPMSATFHLEGQRFLALNAGPHHAFNEAVSFFIQCDDQDEIDYYWNRLTEGGTEQPCGWLKDRFGLSWQVVPRGLGRWLGDPDREKSNRVMQAMLKMRKLVIAALDAAHAGREENP